jgi:hypothetical protein
MLTNPGGWRAFFTSQKKVSTPSQPFSVIFNGSLSTDLVIEDT